MTMTLRQAITLAVSIATSTLAFSSFASAESIPRYDVRTYCKQIGEVAGGSSEIEQTCVQIEQKSYNTLKPQWTDLPAKARNYCDEIARVAGGTYQILETCIQQEVSASHEIPEFEY
jgi:hypothetical protein